MTNMRFIFCLMLPIIFYPHTSTADSPSVVVNTGFCFSVTGSNPTKRYCDKDSGNGSTWAQEIGQSCRDYASSHQNVSPCSGPTDDGVTSRWQVTGCPSGGYISPDGLLCLDDLPEPPSCVAGDSLYQLPFTGLSSPSAPSSTCHNQCTYSIDPTSEICAGETGGTFQCQADYESTGSACNDDDGGDGGGGDGSGDGGDGNGDGDGDGGDQCDPETEDCQEGEYGLGVCDKAERTEPECHSELDIVQCGIYLNNWNRRCDAIQHLTEVYGDGDDIKAATDAGNSVLGDHKNNEIPTDEVDFAGLVDDALDPGLITINSQCPAPLTFTFYGKTYELSWEPMCTIAEGVRPFVIALGYVAAAFIMIRRIKN